MLPFYHGGCSSTKGACLVLQPFLQAPGLPFADVLSEEEVQSACVAEGVALGDSGSTIFTPAVTLWAWLSQVVHAEKLGSCAAAVARLAVLLIALGRKPCSMNTGAYCRARARLPERLLRRLVLDVGHRLEARVPADWLWHGRHVKIADGTTLMMADTDANQATYPQQRSQAPGLGFPRARLVGLRSMATAAVCGVATAACLGKQTGETALLRELLPLLDPGDVLVGDRCYCAYFLLALMQQRGVDAVLRQHACRKTDFRRGRMIARREHVVSWKKPQRPAWMDRAMYASMPATLTVHRRLVVRSEQGLAADRADDGPGAVSLDRPTPGRPPAQPRGTAGRQTPPETLPAPDKTASRGARGASPRASRAALIAGRSPPSPSLLSRRRCRAVANAPKRPRPPARQAPAGASAPTARRCGTSASWHLPPQPRRSSSPLPAAGA